MRKLVCAVLLVGLAVGIGMAAEDLSIDGNLYLNYSTVQNGTSSFSNSRAYLNVKRTLDDNTFVYTSDLDSTLGQYYIYTKYAYVELPKFCALGSVIRFGQIPTPWVNYANDIQGLNYINRGSLAEKAGVLSAADRGISFTQAFDFGLNLDLAYVNGSGYKNADADNRRDWAFKISYDDYDWHIAASTQLTGTGIVSGNASNGNTVLSEYNFLVAYQSKIFTVGAEAMAGSKNDKSISGFSLFAHTEIASNFARIFARYDGYDLDTSLADAAKGISQTGNYNYLILAGIEKEIAQKVKGSINVQNTKDGNNDANTTVYVNVEAKI